MMWNFRSCGGSIYILWIRDLGLDIKINLPPTLLYFYIGLVCIFYLFLLSRDIRLLYSQWINRRKVLLFLFIVCQDIKHNVCGFLNIVYEVLGSRLALSTLEKRWSLILSHWQKVFHKFLTDQFIKTYTFKRLS